MRNIITIVICSVILISLTACTALAVGGAAAAGTTAAVVTDPRTTNVVIDDNMIEVKLHKKYSDIYYDDDVNIYVISYNGEVLLTGQVTTEEIKKNAEVLAHTIPGVIQVYNYLQITSSQSFASITKDSFITTEIRAKLLATNGIKSNNFKIITTNGIVYILGIVTIYQAKEISHTASITNGVKKVITIFDYIK